MSRRMRVFRRLEALMGRMAAETPAAELAALPERRAELQARVDALLGVGGLWSADMGGVLVEWRGERVAYGV